MFMWCDFGDYDEFTDQTYTSEAVGHVFTGGVSWIDERVSSPDETISRIHALYWCTDEKKCKVQL